MPPSAAPIAERTAVRRSGRARLRGSPAPPRRGDGAAVRAAEDTADDRDNRSRHVLPQPGPLVAAGAVLQPGEIRAGLRQLVLAPERAAHRLHLRRVRVLEVERLQLGLFVIE